MIITCKVVNRNSTEHQAVRRIRPQVLGDTNRHVARWIYSVISTISPAAARYAENIHTMKPGGKGLVIKPFGFSLYGTSVGMSIQIRSTTEEFIDWMRKAVADPGALPVLDLRDAAGRGPVLKPEFVRESKNGRTGIQLKADRSPCGRPVLLAESALFTLSPLVLKGSNGHFSLSEAAFSHTGDPGINRHVLKNLLAKYLCNISPDNKPVPREFLEIEMEDKTLAISFDRTAGPGWTKIKGTIVPFIEGPFKLTTHPELLHTALNFGIGHRNGMGFGMVDFDRSKEKRVA